MGLTLHQVEMGHAAENIQADTISASSSSSSPSFSKNDPRSSVHIVEANVGRMISYIRGLAEADRREAAAQIMDGLRKLQAIEVITVRSIFALLSARVPESDATGLVFFSKSNGNKPYCNLHIRATKRGLARHNRDLFPRVNGKACVICRKKPARVSRNERLLNEAKLLY